MKLLSLVSTPYNTVIDNEYWDNQYQQDKTIQRNFIKPLIYENKNNYNKTRGSYISGQYGDKVKPIHCRVSIHFDGSYQFNGNESIEVSGRFGESYQPLITWSQNIIADANKVNQIWPEFKVEGDAKINIH